MSTQKNPLDETVLLSTQSILFKLIGKKIIIVLSSKFLLNLTCGEVKYVCPKYLIGGISPVYLGSHRLERYLKMKGFLENSLERKIALKGI